MLYIYIERRAAIYSSPDLVNLLFSLDPHRYIYNVWRWIFWGLHYLAISAIITIISEITRPGVSQIEIKVYIFTHHSSIYLIIHNFCYFFFYLLIKNLKRELRCTDTSGRHTTGQHAKKIEDEGNVDDRWPMWSSVCWLQPPVGTVGFVYNSRERWNKRRGWW